MSAITRLGFLVLVAVHASAGCSGSKLDTADLSGTVTSEGKPFSGGEVQIYSPQVGVGASAPIDASGNYKVPRPVRPGSYEVMIKGLPPPPPVPDPNYKAPPAPSHPIPKRYQDASTSGLRVELKAGPNTFDIDLVP